MNKQDVKNREYYNDLSEVCLLLSTYRAYKPNSKAAHVAFGELSDKFEKFYHNYLEEENE